MCNWKVLIILALLVPVGMLMPKLPGTVWIVALGLIMYFGPLLHPWLGVKQTNKSD